MKKLFFENVKSINQTIWSVFNKFIALDQIFVYVINDNTPNCRIMPK